MRPAFLIGLIIAGMALAKQLAIGAQEGRPDEGTGAATPTPITQNTGGTGDAMSLGLTGERRPLYRVCKSDVLQVSFTFSPEFDQTVTVQPDGYIVLKGVGSVYVEGATLVAASNAIRDAYGVMLREPVVTLTLKEFEKPYFIAAGEVGHPGKYELRSETTVTEAVAIAGGFTQQAKHSQVVVFRRVSGQTVKTWVLNIKEELRARKLDEDMRLRPGDLVYVPQNQISKVRKFIPLPSLGMYYNPSNF